ncbi:MAG: CotH kinase family protein [Alloprevotella sp.]|nr:CotH kinase family protein [Alloprevotella sp.]
MKHFLLTLSLLLCAAAATATPNIKSGSKYFFSVGSVNYDGYIGLGSYHNVSPYIYLYTGDDTLEDAYWVVTKDGSGYTFKNAATGQYLSFTTGRNNNYYKYLTLTTPTSVTDNERWTFELISNGIYAIRSVANTSYYFNYRTDGTQMLGAYAGSSRTQNEQFSFFSEDGTQVFETGSAETGTAITVGKTYTLTSQNYGRALSNKGSSSISNSYVYIETLVSGSGKQKWKAITAGSGFQLYNETYGYALDANVSNMRPLQWTAQTSNANQQWFFTEIGTNVFQIYVKNKYTNYYLAADGYNTSLTTDDTDTDTYWVVEETTAPQTSTEAGSLSEVATNILFNDRPLVYDLTSGQYFFSLPESARGGADFTMKVSWTNVGNYSLIAEIDGNLVANGSETTLAAVSCLNPYTLSFYNRDTNELVATGTLNFTFLPLVEMTYTGDPSAGYTPGTLSVHDGSDLYQTSPAKVKWRGASARNKPKHPYAIKLTDADGVKTDLSFFGLRSDNNWILDPAYIDKTCLRNRVSTDLWNDFSAKPYQYEWEPEAINGTRGKFVELFINGSYIGLHCMTEKVDRKQLKLKKYVEPTDTTEAVVRGSLYKGKSWSYEIMWGPASSEYTSSSLAPRSFSNTSETWCSYEVKEPDLGDGEQIKWDPLWNAINFTCTSSDEEFYTNYATYLDRPVVDDYYLFLELILASDNHGKNTYFYVYNQNATKKAPQRISIAPWDLDGTWGGRWDGSYYYTGASQDFMTFTKKYEHGTLYFWERMNNISSFAWQEALADRYRVLRRTHFQPEALKERFQTYYDLIHESGADSREQNKWSSAHGDIATAVSYVQDWIDERVAYLDEKYAYTESDASFTIGETGLATYYNSLSYVLPDGVEAAVITAANGDNLTIDWRFPAGSTVPGGTAVLLRGAAGTYSFKAYPTAANESPVENMLHGSDVLTRTTGDGLHYKLAADSDGSSAGFYFADSSTRAGAPFWSAAHKCWLVVPGAASTRGYSLGEATSISTATLTDAQGNNAYDLSGRRIRPTGQRGIYIVNGKKVLR